MPAPKKNKFIVKKPLYDHLVNSFHEFDYAEFEFENEIIVFIENCKEDRKEARSKALAGGEDRTTVKTCPYILTYRFHTGSLHLYWTEVVYRKGKGGKKMYKSLRINNNKTNMAQIIAKAHPAEVAVLLKHEDQARKFRDFWTNFVKVRSGVRNFCKGLEVEPV